MRVEQIRVSRNVKFFAGRMQHKFKLRPYDDPTKPVIMYGVYNTDDYEFFKNFEQPMIVLWRGTDAQVVNEGKAKIILSKPCRHYAVSRQVQKSLERFGIMSEVKAITSTDPSIKCQPRGEYVYCYISSNVNVMRSKYKYGWLRYLQRKLPYKFIFTTIRQYPEDKLMKIYRKCFVGVRLLGHDGMSNSILEMGLMGRRTISNSGLPHTIPWKELKDVKKSIIKEYNHRREDNSSISTAYKKLINIDNKWLELE